MDINKLALELQQNQSVRQKIYAQYMNNQDDFFFQNFHGILEEKVCLNIYNMLKNIKS